MSFADLDRCGVSRRRLRTMLLHQSWVAVRRAAYVEAGRPSIRMLLSAAEVSLGGGWVASHATAAHLHGLALLRRPRPDRLVLTLPSAAKGHADLYGIHFHRAALHPDHVDVFEGVPLTTVARTLVDLARALPLRDGLVAMDAALHAGQVTQEQLMAVVSECRRWPWVRRAARAVALSDPAAESPLESVSRLFFIDHDIPMPTSQVTLTRRGLFLARSDFWWEAQRVAGEADGLAKYTDAAVLRAEKLRQERIESAGIRVARWTWYDVDRLQESRRTAARLRRILGLSA
jgi:hypothetical protein